MSNLKVARWKLGAYLLACKTSASSAAGGLCTIVWGLAVINCEVGSEEIRPAKVERLSQKIIVGTDKIFCYLFYIILRLIAFPHPQTKPTQLCTTHKTQEKDH